MTKTNNVYLSGNFAPVKEEVDLECTQIEGTLPNDLAGCFLRVGPNVQFDPIAPEKYHPFDGDGMIHEMQFEDGSAAYRNRWVRTKGFELEREEGRALWSGFLDIAAMQHPPGMMMKNLANTAMVWHANRLLATWEGGSPYEISLPDLRTLGEETFAGKWEGAVTAHPSVDPKTGEMIFFGYSVMGPPYVRYGVLDASGKLKHETGIDLPKPVMIHDLAITSNYSLILDMPVTFSIERAMNGGMAFDWEPSNGARIGVLPRFADGSEIRWFDVDDGYIFHCFNAWEEGDEVVLEACRASKTRILSEEEDSLSEQKSRLHQYRLNMVTSRASERQVSDVPMEFCRINEAYVGVKNRYGYASRFCEDPSKAGTLFTALLKCDREANTIEALEMGDQRFTQEFVFAPRLDSRSEDDGYLVGLVFDEGRESSECWVIDAQKFSAGPIARVRTPTRVPYGFHSSWVSAQDIAGQVLHLAA